MTDTAAAGSASPHPQDDNIKSRYEIAKEKFARLDAIEGEMKTLRDEAETIRKSMEDDVGYTRGAVASVRKLRRLDSATAMQKHIDGRNELEDIFIKPILEQAAAGQTDED